MLKNFLEGIRMNHLNSVLIEGIAKNVKSFRDEQDLPSAITFNVQSKRTFKNDEGNLEDEYNVLSAMFRRKDNHSQVYMNTIYTGLQNDVGVRIVGRIEAHAEGSVIIIAEHIEVRRKDVWESVHAVDR
jgi:hypothetical protein